MTILAAPPFTPVPVRVVIPGTWVDTLITARRGRRKRGVRGRAAQVHSETHRQSQRKVAKEAAVKDFRTINTSHSLRRRDENTDPPVVAAQGAQIHAARLALAAAVPAVVAVTYMKCIRQKAEVSHCLEKVAY